MGSPGRAGAGHARLAATDSLPRALASSQAHGSRVGAAIAHAIRARLRSFTADDLKTAITNSCADPFYQGDNKRGKRYDWIKTLLKNDEAVERHLENGKATTTDSRTMSAEELREWEEGL